MDVYDVVGAYGGVMEKYASEAIIDASVLPFPKDVIKTAILSLAVNETDKKLLDTLKSGLYVLSKFQAGVGVSVGSLAPLNLANSKAPSDDELLAYAEKIAAPDSNYNKYLRFESLVKAEADEFMKEFDEVLSQNEKSVKPIEAPTVQLAKTECIRVLTPRSSWAYFGNIFLTLLAFLMVLNYFIHFDAATKNLYFYALVLAFILTPSIGKFIQK